jgi:hypothetical protein
MSEKSERAAREIEKLLKERDLFIDGGFLRTILAYEFEGGDAPCPNTRSPCDAEPTVQPAGSANFTPKEILDWLREHPGACPICGAWETRARESLDLFKAVTEDRNKLRQELLDAKHKAYSDYREYVGLISQNESLRRQVDDLQRRLSAEFD